MSTCTSCGAEIVWARFAGSERRVPIDPQPVNGGNLTLDASTTGAPVATTLTKAEIGLRIGLPTYVTHFATCPNANQHRTHARRTP